MGLLPLQQTYTSREVMIHFSIKLGSLRQEDPETKFESLFQKRQRPILVSMKAFQFENFRRQEHAGTNFSSLHKITRQKKKNDLVIAIYYADLSKLCPENLPLVLNYILKQHQHKNCASVAS